MFLQIAGLSALGIAQPLLQLVQQNPGFLVAHQVRSWDILLLTTALFFLPPVGLSMVVFLLGLVRAGARRTTLSLMLGGLLTLILLPIIDNLPAVTGGLTLALAVIPAAALTFLYGRSLFLRQNLAYLTLALPVFLFLFLGSGPIRQILWPDPPPAMGPDQAVTSPVVVIIFDEFPTSSLLGPDQELDRRLFPNFGRLADSSTWYRNGTTISPATLRSVPAILSGKFPQWKEAPTLADHPQNLFTLMGSSHRVSALECQTSLCPEELKTGPMPALAQRLDLLFVDLAILYQHIVVPEKWRGGLVPISDKWGNFRGTGGRSGEGRGQGNRMEQFEAFLASLDVGRKPNLIVAHLLLPHVPFHFLPDGRTYNTRQRIPVLPDLTWGPDRLVMAHSYRRHLLQVVAVDRLLGRLLDRLDQLGIFDEAAIVITADHGAAYRTGLSRRQFHPGNAADILGVPLFIKFPGQTEGVIDDRFAQTIDILPTLAAAAGCNLPWACDGIDLLDKTSCDRTELDFLDQDVYEHRKLAPEILAARNDVIEWSQRLFGNEGGWERLFGMGDTNGLMGQDVAGFQIKDHPTLRGRLLEPQALERVDLNGSFIPAEINGTLRGHDGDGRLTLALALNGKIAGVSETYLDGPEPNTLNWQITAPPSAFRQGANEVELYLVRGSGPDSGLVRIPLSTPSPLDINLGTQRVNGTRLLSQVLPQGPWETRLPLTGVETDRSLTVELDSSVFTPAEDYVNSTDTRKLGLALTTLIVE